MAITQAQAILNFMSVTDNFLASLRINIDNQQTTSTIQMLNVLRCQNYGENIDIFNNGVIFGIQVCQIKNLGDTWSIFYGPFGPTQSLLKNTNMNDWVVSRGNIFDGSKIVNIEPLTGEAYVYKVNPYITSQMGNYLVPGAVFYSTSTVSFKTVLSGQVNNSYPIIGVEKTGIDTDEFIQMALNYKYFNEIFYTQRSAGDIMVCRFILDINSETDYQIYVLNERDLYPFIYGQTYYSFMMFSGEIYNYINNAIVLGYDSNVVYEMMYYIVNAEVWGTGTNPFYTYWTTGGRVLPDNVKYYYNLLFTPIIP